MIRIVVENPTELWIELGRKFFSDEYNKIIDIKLGDRRFVSIENSLVITNWPKDWDGQAMFDLVGYSPKGYKMNLLRKTYVKEDLWEDLKRSVTEDSKGFSSRGMNFNMSLQKKGGCLSSLHLIQSRGRNILFVHGKIAEIPRKFIADLILIRDLLQELSVWPMEVRFMYSLMYYSIIGLRAYLPVLGTSQMDLHGLPIFQPRNYQAGIIEAINKYQERFTNKERREGVWKNLNLNTGEWKGQKLICK